MRTLTIGEVAKAAGMTSPTIRYYEQIGLIPLSHRSESGYRLYSQEDVQRLRFIQRAKMLSLSLGEIREIVGYAIDGRCSAVQNELLRLLRKKLTETQRQITELALFHEELSRLCDDLSARLASGLEEAAPSVERCRCLDEHGNPCK